MLISVSAYIIAFFTAVLVVRIFNPAHPLAVLAIGDLAATVVIFLISMAVNNSSMYDPYWSVKPIVFAAYYFLSIEVETGLRGILVLVLVFLYALRLTSNFYRDWPGLVKEDFRYVNFRRKFPKAYWLISFLAVHFFPTVMVYLGCLPLFGIYTESGSALNIFDLIGTIVLLFAVILAFIADEQLRIFKEMPGNNGKTIAAGLWKYSRHPNYLGEIMTWWGLWFFALASGFSWWWTVIGALAITLLFVFASIPLMEARMMETRQDYKEYRKKTPMLVPWKW